MTRTWRLLVGAELKTVSRDTAGLIIPIALPLLVLVGNALNLPAESLARYVVPLVLVIVIATIGLVNMPSVLATYRTTGVLRRLAVTPVRPEAVLGAHLTAGGVQILGGVLLAAAVAVAGFGAAAPADLLVTAGVILLTTVAMFAGGLLIAAVAPTVNAALAIGLLVFFGLGGVGGMFGPVTNLPGWLARVGEALPFGAAVRALTAAWTGGGPAWGSLLALAACTVVCGFTATRFFRWS
ncbi:ABC transporter permease [Paractinoplanes rishiriensis]|uniref:Transport permease protein n=1 Tax=Paractinoplanes rishiriensis TaxID=1050105 RepID=A0A919K4L6_9ACTN|nr:ABC transporter permease [Actinoplanes rishiriensis]GIE98742.1 transport permease protein [Actinoplanes rishiriensis]